MDNTGFNLDKMFRDDPELISMFQEIDEDASASKAKPEKTSKSSSREESVNYNRSSPDMYDYPRDTVKIVDIEDSETIKVASSTDTIKHNAEKALKDIWNNNTYNNTYNNTDNNTESAAVMETIGTIDNIKEEDFLPAELIFPVEKTNKFYRVASIVSKVFFNIGMILIILAAFAFVQSNYSENDISGYRFLIPTSEYKKGALVVTKEVNTDRINEGDDIVLYESADNIVIRRVVDVIEDYEGERGFSTSNIETSLVYGDIVYASNVRGTPSFSIPVLGYVTEYLANSITITFIMIGLIMLTSFALKIYLGSQEQ